VANSALPEGNSGIAAEYLGDAGIAADARVLFFDDFEGYRGIDDLWGRYDGFYQQFNVKLETVGAFAGTQSLAVTLPKIASAQYNAVTKTVAPQDVLFVRFYTKLDAGFAVTASAGHNGVNISASYDGPGVYPNGTNHFYVGLENTVWRGEPQPGYTHAYVYHMDQRSGYGDLWFADGHVIPQDQVPGNFGPDFVARPLHTPEPGKWYCVELMVQANAVGARDGRVAAWIDGKLIADWQNVRFRSVATLKIDKFELVLGAASNPAADRQWFDHVVVAKSYIGPMVTKVTPPPVEPPEEPTPMELAAMIAAVQAYAERLQAGLDAIGVRLAALEARPTDPEIAARVAAVEAAIADLKSFDKKISDL
jgi:hypothetical protein